MPDLDRPAVSRPERLKSRAEFLAAAQGARRRERRFVVQAVRPEKRADLPPRFGFTATKKTGGAVERNRIKRRLRAAVRLAAEAAQPGCDYVIVARRETLTAPFNELTQDIQRALSVLSAASAAHASRQAAPSARKRDQALSS